MTALDEPVIEAEIVTSVSRPDAERLDKRIRLLADSINNNLAKLYELVELAKVGEIHVVLGFPSWPAYIADVFGGQVRLDREQRRELVGYLSGEGMSQRAIAEVVAVDQKTVTNDLRAREENSSPEPAGADRKTAAEAHPVTVTGRDGKTYPAKQEQKRKPRRGDLPKTFEHTVQDLWKLTERFERLCADDRFTRNRAELM